MSGKFITFEGGEGSGKTTQAWALAERLELTGGSIVLTREPGGSAGGEDIRKLLVEGEPDRWSTEAEILLFYAARDDHIRRLIRPALTAGKYVICDRFADSTRAYQGGQSSKLDQLIAALDDAIVVDTRPDLTILLDIDPAKGLQRAHSRQSGDNSEARSEDRFEQKDLAYHQKLRDAFLQIAQSAPERIVILDADRSSADIERDIWHVVAARFALT